MLRSLGTWERFEIHSHVLQAANFENRRSTKVGFMACFPSYRFTLPFLRTAVCKFVSK